MIVLNKQMHNIYRCLINEQITLTQYQLQLFTITVIIMAIKAIYRICTKIFLIKQMYNILNQRKKTTLT